MGRNSQRGSESGEGGALGGGAEGETDAERNSSVEGIRTDDFAGFPLVGNARPGSKENLQVCFTHQATVVGSIGKIPCRQPD
jgi:hypothetical protein